MFGSPALRDQLDPDQVGRIRVGHRRGQYSIAAAYRCSVAARASRCRRSCGCLERGLFEASLTILWDAAVGLWGSIGRHCDSGTAIVRAWRPRAHSCCLRWEAM
eukprot:2672793-Prymnesium_polylepis.1